MDRHVALLSNIIFRLIGLQIPVEQLSLLVSLIISLFGAFIFKLFIYPSKLSRNVKLSSVSLFGVFLFSSNWGSIIYLPLFEVILSYLLFKLIPIKKSSKIVFFIAMIGLSLCNFYVVYTRYNDVIFKNTPDFTGTVMVLTQRLTSFSCSLYDGVACEEVKLSESRRRNRIKKLPTFVEYFSYMFNFFGILVGPLVFYNDFIIVFEDENAKDEEKSSNKTAPICKKFFSGILMIIIFVVGGRLFPFKIISDSVFTKQQLLRKIFYIYISLFAVRAKYYGVWLIGDSIFNAAGIGFTGYDQDGNAKWDGASNINIQKIEFATGFKDYIDNWNIMTVKWIRLVAYDRTKRDYRTIISFLLSAFWHGFFPGYYVMFATCHVFLLLQRKFRRVFRERFQSTKQHRMLYDTFGFIVTQLAILYGAVPFVLLEFTASFNFYRSLGFVGNILPLFILLMIPIKKEEYFGKRKEK